MKQSHYLLMLPDDNIANKNSRINDTVPAVYGMYMYVQGRALGHWISCSIIFCLTLPRARLVATKP